MQAFKDSGRVNAILLFTSPLDAPKPEFYSPESMFPNKAFGFYSNQSISHAWNLKVCI